jgi:hypothetical protein
MSKLTEFQVRRIRELRADGYTQRQVADMVGCSTSPVAKYAPGRVGKVPVAPVREAFLASGRTAVDVARRAGWMYTRSSGLTVADGSLVKRSLGLLDDSSGGTGRRSRRKVMDAEMAATLAEAIGVAPWEVIEDAA